MENRQIKLIARPTGLPTPDAWSIIDTPIPEPADGEVLVRTHYISLDPAMRGWMRAGRSYIAAVELGAVMRAGTVGRVVKSRDPAFAPGDAVSGFGGVQRYHVARASDLIPIDTDFAPIETYLGVLGMTGMTAYFGLLDIGAPKPGQTVLVSGAAGAVGSVVGQIAKIEGCRTVGIAGGERKCRYIVEELGFDAAVDYKAEGSLRQRLKAACPDGVDVYFDNVGGEILDLALTRINRNARIVICGAISQYNATQRVPGPANYLSLLVNRARMEGMVVFDYRDRYAEAAGVMAAWIAEGRLQSHTTILDGLDTFPEALLRLFDGKKLGKLVLRIIDPA